MLLASCQRQKPADIDVPQKSKLASFTFIGAGEMAVKTTVMRSRPFFGASAQLSPAYLTNAEGRLIGRNQSLAFNYSEGEALYVAPLTGEVKPGEKFAVQFADGAEATRGSTTIPFPAKASITAKVTSSPGNENFTSYSIDITCTSRSEGQNYLRLYPVLVFSDSNFAVLSDFFSVTEMKPLKNGGSFKQNFSSTSSPSVFPVRLEVTVVTCDEAYAKYSNSVGGFDFSMQPGLGEPKFIYSNMSSGLGVVCSYAFSDRVIIDLK